MKALFKDKLLLAVIAYLLVVLVAIPLTLYSIKKPLETRTKALGNATLAYNPSPLQTNTGQTINLDIMLNPNTHSVSFVTVDIIYDPTILSLNQETAFQPNTSAFPNTLEGPVFAPGRVRASLSIGSDPTKVITTNTKVATISFTAETPTNGQQALVHFGESSYVLSAGPNDNAIDNVLNAVSPALMTITGEPTGNGGPPVTPVPTFGGPSPTITPLPTNDLTPTSEVSSTPDPSISPELSPTPEPFCEESERRSGWPECHYGVSTYDKQACREKAENWKGVQGPDDDSDASWYTWATNPPKPLSCGTSCGIAPSVCQDATPTASPTATIQPTNTEIPPSVTSAFTDEFNTNQVNPTDILLVSLLMLPLLLLVGHLLV